MEDLKAKIQSSSIYNILTNTQSTRLFSSTKDALLDASVGGVVFLSGISATQVFQRIIGVSASNRVLSSTIGGIGVIASSIGAVSFAPLPRQATMQFSSSNPQFSLNRVEFTSAAVTGILLFKLLKGSFFRIAPSDFRNTGAFSQKRASLPATLDYADGSARAVISMLGKRVGCHTCGTRKSASYHADHMPPVNFVKKANSRFYRRIFGYKMSQRFYPQCESCSNAQGICVQKNLKKLKLHLHETRAYHTTGFWITLLLTGGIINQKKKDDHRLSAVIADKAVDVLQYPRIAILNQEEKWYKSWRDSKHTDYRQKKEYNQRLCQIEREKARIRKEASRQS